MIVLSRAIRRPIRIARKLIQQLQQGAKRGLGRRQQWCGQWDIDYSACGKMYRLLGDKNMPVESCLYSRVHDATLAALATQCQ